MKRVFSETQNVRNFLSTVDKVRNNAEDTPSMALVYGDPGTGKTRTATWFTNKEDRAIYCRCINNMSQHWFLETIVYEAGEIPLYRTSNLFNQIKDLFMTRQKILVIDEIDYICATGAVEVLRDIHDSTNVPIILIGMSLADKKLMRFKHLYDRLIGVVRFMPLSRQDIQSVITQMCEVRLSDDGIDFLIEETGGKFRSLILNIHRAEHIGRVNGLKEITAKHLKR